MENIRTLRELLIFAQQKYTNIAAFLVRNGSGFDTITYDKFVNETLSLASSFVDKGYEGKRIALVGENSYLWAVSYMAAVSAGAVIVPLDRELQSYETAELVKRSGCSALIYSEGFDFHYKEQIDAYASIDTYTMYSTHINDDTVSLESLIESGGKAKDSNYSKLMSVELNENALCSVVFTSGTTGISKGAMLSHKNLLSNAKASRDLIILRGVRLSLLPMHHTYEFTLGNIYYYLNGCTVAINHSIKYISQNMKLFAPTTLAAVPLIAETFYNNIWANIKSSGKERAVRNMIRITRFLRSIGIDVRRKVFKSIIDGLGGNLQHIFCGGAHVDEEVAKGFVDFGINFYIGYGITECSPLITANIYCDLKKMKSCGKAITCCEVRIASGNDTEGEVECRGDNVMLGYLDNPEATAEVMNGEWYRTGDIGRFDKDGDLYITGRIKNIIVLRNGKNIYPEEIEAYLYKIPYIKEVLVYGSSTTTGEELSIMAEVYPNMDKAAEDNIGDVKDVIKRGIDDINKSISYYKRIADVKFRDDEFEKTTSRKIKRNRG